MPKNQSQTSQSDPDQQPAIKFKTGKNIEIRNNLTIGRPLAEFEHVEDLSASDNRTIMGGNVTPGLVKEAVKRDPPPPAPKKSWLKEIAAGIFVAVVAGLVLAYLLGKPG